ncbi:thioredoxin domain-containing protein [Ancylomarina sp. 16SWW S1-10-2]|uniref:thioredoxin domain-containing protein n=1 Tax=Ancylomarina sp. 16SWW S1-10-2 TaxID=2499681 RepID=UPI0012ADB53C|nr:thioredoxin domain-containing protein [Ancylomarina sp. 16SWW S1-10-2]MRT93258.1 thioredoxin domain-containing protein [Ancylomarina sp. 16SWW S1-10-2]
MKIKYAFVILAIAFLVVITVNSAGAQIQNKGMKEKHTNSLINETSPYLLQHAHNPVNWYPWGDKALAKAKAEDKPLLISIGYSACHWCHVMEHESFENEEIAKLMNELFVCVKVDREERPDIDQVYMDAVQLITGRGGWPLNCFALPDGQPFYGGTYFPSNDWVQVLKAISKTYITEKDKVLKSAEQISEDVRATGLIEEKVNNSSYSMKDLDRTVNAWKSSFDKDYGGENRAPKFPIPISLEFLLNYYFYSKDAEVLDHLTLSLDKMAEGGIYDQIGGGFSRYSVDKYWKVPHFEKMLYDNAQLLSLYAKAYRLTKKPLYKRVIQETIGFIERELAQTEGGFNSALDADSEGVEGKFYVWEKEEVDHVLGDKSSMFSEYFEVLESANWEEGNILHIKKDKLDLLKKYQMTEAVFDNSIKESKDKLLVARAERISPGLDDKFLTSWNALLIKGYIDSYKAIGDDAYLEKAIQIADFINERMSKSGVQLFRTFKNGDSRINAFLDDYSFTIEAFIALYQVSFDETWLQRADAMTAYVIENFYDDKSGMFFYTSIKDAELVARKMEVMDNVIPSSNASMAESLYLLGNILGKQAYIGISEQMLSNMKEQTLKYLSYHGKWANLMLKQIESPYELVISGKNAKKFQRDFNTSFYPNVLVLGSEHESDLPLLKNRFSNEITSFYLCKDKACFLPTSNINEIIKRIDVK